MAKSEDENTEMPYPYTLLVVYPKRMSMDKYGHPEDEQAFRFMKDLFRDTRWLWVEDVAMYSFQRFEKTFPKFVADTRKQWPDIGAFEGTDPFAENLWLILQDRNLPDITKARVWYCSTRRANWPDLALAYAEGTSAVQHIYMFGYNRDLT